MKNNIQISEKDNVVVALKKLTQGELLPPFDTRVVQDVDLGHKIAVCDIKKGEPVIKYAHVIGRACADIKNGETVHTHNLATNLGKKMSYSYHPTLTEIKTNGKSTFKGFVRENGEVGIRNEIWIIPTVGCMNSVATAIAQKAKPMLKGTVGDVVAFLHPYGCSQMGEDQSNTKKVLAGLAKHPNVGGALLLGLGCENCPTESIVTYLGDFDSKKIRFLTAQHGEDEGESARKIVSELIENVCYLERSAVSLDKLTVGLKCGGSDGLSGITANPTLGVYSDLLISHGGSTILTEVPEMFGAETILMNRCKDKTVFDKTVNLIENFKDYFTRHDQVVYENPSPGNKEGGISTLEDKSLGCTQKSGSANVVDVLSYAEPIKTKGLNLLCAPGNDLVASTALAVSGAQLILFTTGRGTPFASPVPTIKISSNTQLYKKKRNWIDFDTGSIVKGTSIDEMGEKLFEKVLAVANGEQVKSEKNGYHDMAIFKQGVTL